MSSLFVKLNQREIQTVKQSTKTHAALHSLHQIHGCDLVKWHALAFCRTSWLWYHLFTSWLCIMFTSWLCIIYLPHGSGIIYLPHRSGIIYLPHGSGVIYSVLLYLDDGDASDCDCWYAGGDGSESV